MIYVPGICVRLYLSSNSVVVNSLSLLLLVVVVVIALFKFATVITKQLRIAVYLTQLYAPEMMLYIVYCLHTQNINIVIPGILLQYTGMFYRIYYHSVTWPCASFFVGSPWSEDSKRFQQNKIMYKFQNENNAHYYEKLRTSTKSLGGNMIIT